MARPIKTVAIATRRDREKLCPRGKPYYHLIEPELYLGYRKLEKGPGSWVTRRYIGNQKYSHDVVGIADDDPDMILSISFEGIVRKLTAQSTRELQNLEKVVKEVEDLISKRRGNGRAIELDENFVQDQVYKYAPRYGFDPPQQNAHCVDRRHFLYRARQSRLDMKHLYKAEGLVKKTDSLIRRRNRK